MSLETVSVLPVTEAAVSLAVLADDLESVLDLLSLGSTV